MRHGKYARLKVILEEKFPLLIIILMMMMMIMIIALKGTVVSNMHAHVAAA